MDLSSFHHEIGNCREHLTKKKMTNIVWINELSNIGSIESNWRCYCSFIQVLTTYLNKIYTNVSKLKLVQKLYS